jgi:hypothetical protein
MRGAEFHRIARGRNRTRRRRDFGDRCGRQSNPHSLVTISGILRPLDQGVLSRSDIGSSDAVPVPIPVEGKGPPALGDHVAQSKGASLGYRSLAKPSKLEEGLRAGSVEAFPCHRFRQQRKCECGEDSKKRQRDEDLDQGEAPRGARRRTPRIPASIRAPRGSHLTCPK